MKRSDISDAEILAACDAYHASPYDTPPPTVALADRYPPKVIVAKMKQMDRRGQIDYGTTLEAAWVVRRPIPPSPIGLSFLPSGRWTPPACGPQSGKPAAR